MSNFAFSQVEPETSGFVTHVPTPVTDYLGAAYEQGYEGSAWKSIKNMSEYSLEAGDDGAPMLDAKTATDMYGIPGQLKFDKPTRETVASLMQSRKKMEMDRNFLLENGQNAATFVPGLAAGFLGGLLTPLDPALMFLPIVGEDKFARAASIMGRGTLRQSLARGVISREAIEGTGIAFPRFVESLLQGTVGQAVFELPTILEHQQTGQEYTTSEFLKNVAVGGVFAGALHLGVSAAWRIFHGLQPATQEAMLRQKMNDFLMDRESDISKYANIDPEKILQDVLREHEEEITQQAQELFADNTFDPQSMTREELSKAGYHPMYNPGGELIQLLDSNGNEVSINKIDKPITSEISEEVKQTQEQRIQQFMDDARKNFDPAKKFAEYKQREIDRMRQQGQVMPKEEVEKHQRAEVPTEEEANKIQADAEELRNNLKVERPPEEEGLVDKALKKIDKAIDDLGKSPGLLSDPFLIQTLGKPILRGALIVVREMLHAGKSIAEAVDVAMHYIGQKWAEPAPQKKGMNRRRFLDILGKVAAATQVPLNPAALLKEVPIKLPRISVSELSEVYHAFWRDVPGKEHLDTWDVGDEIIKLARRSETWKKLREGVSDEKMKRFVDYDVLESHSSAGIWTNGYSDKQEMLSKIASGDKEFISTLKDDIADLELHDPRELQRHVWRNQNPTLDRNTVPIDLQHLPNSVIDLYSNTFADFDKAHKLEPGAKKELMDLIKKHLDQPEVQAFLSGKLTKADLQHIQQAKHSADMSQLKLENSLGEDHPEPWNRKLNSKQEELQKLAQQDKQHYETVQKDMQEKMQVKSPEELKTEQPKDLRTQIREALMKEIGGTEAPPEAKLQINDEFSLNLVGRTSEATYPNGGNMRFAYRDSNGNKVGSLDLSKTSRGWNIENHYLENSVRGAGLGRQAIMKLVDVLGEISSIPIERTEAATKMWQAIGGEKLKGEYEGYTNVEKQGAYRLQSKQSLTPEEFSQKTDKLFPDTGTMDPVYVRETVESRLWSIDNMNPHPEAVDEALNCILRKIA